MTLLSGGRRSKLLKLLAPSVPVIKEENLEKNLQIPLPRNIISQICASINSGKHIILAGAPGTGKTTIAQAICKTAYEQLLSLERGIFSTATSDWSTFDTVGGYLPDFNDNGKLRFSEGIITRAIKRREWLIIDEINRADIDKAIGPFFSVLSDHEVVLPFKSQMGVNIRITPGTGNTSDDVIYVHPNWRLIGTMNDFDKLSLFEISYAFLRRFAVVKIPLPSVDELSKIVSKVVPNCNLDNGMKKLFSITKHREIGPSIFLDMAMYIAQRCPQASSQTSEYLKEAVEIFLTPQFEGLNKNVKREIANIITVAIPDYVFNEENLVFSLKEEVAAPVSLDTAVEPVEGTATAVEGVTVAQEELVSPKVELNEEAIQALGEGITIKSEATPAPEEEVNASNAEGE
ncbi:AAA family ATPase [Paenibacillus sp. MCAF9]|uniref:AAA family ATPase n=1 Tax=Paenibacillus sp. MCAF9 TaxID=3233046 RepID=UPI003F997DF2